MEKHIAFRYIVVSADERFVVAAPNPGHFYPCDMIPNCYKWLCYQDAVDYLNSFIELKDAKVVKLHYVIENI